MAKARSSACTVPTPWIPVPRTKRRRCRPTYSPNLRVRARKTSPAMGYHWMPHKGGQWAWKWTGATQSIGASAAASVRGQAGSVMAPKTLARFTASLQQGRPALKATQAQVAPRAKPLASPAPPAAQSDLAHSRRASAIQQAHERLVAVEQLRMRASRWQQQWREIWHVRKFPTKDWAICSAVLTGLAFTEWAVVGPMRRERELDALLLRRMLEKD